MKTFLALTFLTLSLGSAHAAQPVLSASYNPGFTPNPVSREFVLSDDGKLTVVTTQFRNDSKTVKDLGTLSAEALAGIVQRVSTLDPRDQLEDEQPNQPRCTDAPYSSTFAYVNGQKLELSRDASCHQYALPGNAGADLAAFARLFLQL